MGLDRWGFEFTLKWAWLGAGGSVTIGGSYDTQSNEVGVSITGGYRAGVKLGATGQVYVEPSSVKSNEFKVGEQAKAEGDTEVKIKSGKLGASGEASIGGYYSTKTGTSGIAPNADGNISTKLGGASTDSNGRVTLARGGADVGVAVGADVNVSGNVSITLVNQAISDIVSPPPPPKQPEWRNPR